VREEFCLCPDVPVVRTRTEVCVLRHAFEAFKSTNTARVAALALPSLRIVDYDPGTPPDIDALIAASAPACLLFPGGESVPPEEPPRTLVVLDGTWAQVRKMSHRHPGLLRLPRLSLSPGEGNVRRLRVSPRAGARSTLEAIADALELLEGPEVSRPLLALHDRMVERILAARGTPREG
jgi:DTW domain-containing protein YfiP